MAVSLAVALFGIFATLLGILVTYLVYIQSTKPDATEIAGELRDGLEAGSGGSHLRGEYSLAKVIDVKVTGNDEWVNSLANPEKTRTYAFIKGLFLVAPQLHSI